MEAATISDQQTGCCEEKLTCKHCGSSVAGGAEFCCSGCEAAHANAVELGIATSFSHSAQELDDGAFQLELGVEGIHCAACIRLIENALLDNEEVVSARVNMSTERVTFSWVGEVSQGDALANKIEMLGYKLYDLTSKSKNAQLDETERDLIKCIAVSGFAAGNLMLISVGLWTTTAETMGMATRDLFHWVSALIALPTVAFSGRPFFRSALGVLRQGHTNMDVPISLAVILACVMSISEAMRGGEHVYFDSAVMLLFFLLIGRFLDARAKGKARQSASNLLSKLGGTAAVYENDELIRIPIKDLQADMRVLVAAGENIPADGRLVSGISEVDQSLINGETVPIAVTAGDNVFAGTVNLLSPIEVLVEKASSKSLLSEIVRMMEVAEQGAAKYVRLADRAATLYTPVVHAFGALTFLGWMFVMSAPWQISLLHAVTVLIITCPCALGLAVPVVQVLASGELLKNGVLLKSGDALERLSKVDTVVFDKTGTLTLGVPELVGGTYGPDELRLAAALASRSRHPLSKAISVACEGKLDELDVSEIPGKGLEAKWNGKLVRLGSRSWCGPAEGGGATELELWLSVDQEPVASFVLADTLRDDARDTVQRLKAAGLDLHLLSGDRKKTAKFVAASLGIKTVTAEVSPTEKCDYLNQLRDEGRQVLMVGDGLNDAPALAAANASMSPSSAIDIAQNTADIVFQGNRLAPVADTIVTARRSTILVKQNFGLAVAYNIVAIPLAVMGYVTPMVAAAAMSGSSLVVILNAFRLKKKRAG